MVDRTGGQQIESEAKALREGMDPATIWIKKILKAKDDERKWREEAEIGIGIYEADDDALTRTKGRPISFNIYHSNIETMVPAAYNSTPIPDIRRRYDDPDPQSKLVVDTIERCLTFSVDQYDFDGTMRAAVRDALACGRGVVRVRYQPTIEMQPDPMTGEPAEIKTYEEVTCELVPWDRFIRGPARSWEQMPWIAFEHDLTRDEIEELAGPERAAEVKPTGEDNDRSRGWRDLQAKPDAGILKTTKVYEIWDKRSASVIFLEEHEDREPLKVERDPLGMPGFFPVPKPLQPITRVRSMTPVCPYTVYAMLIRELDEVTKRISKLVRQLRVRGIYDSELKADLTALQDADDGTYLPAEDATRFAQGAGGLEKAIAHMPLEPSVMALKELYTQREAIKQTIYEVTGLADIVRGSSAASETATAQQIKAQYAGLRIQSLQKEVARLARDLFRMKAALFCGHFSTENLQMMTGLPVGQVEQIIRSPQMRSYRIDIETDSTVRGDVSRALQQMTEFLAGTGQFVQAVGAMVQVVPPLLQPLMDVYAAFARKFDLGKQAEDALDKMPQIVQQFLQQQAQAAQQPSPEQQKAELDAKARQDEMAMRREEHGLEMQARQSEIVLDQQSKQADMAFQREKAGLDLEAKREAAMIDVAKSQMMPQRPPNGAAR